MKKSGRPVKQNKTKFFRVSIRVVEDVVTTLDRLMEVTGATTKVEIFRNAIKIYSLVVQGSKDGKKLYLEHPDSPNERTYIVI